MNDTDQAVTMGQWELHINAQKAEEIDALIADLMGTAAALESEIRHAEAEAGISDVSDMTYPTSAMAFRARLENIQRTLRRLAIERQAAETDLRRARGVPSRQGNGQADRP